jgi:hypothetical protein
MPAWGGSEFTGRFNRRAAISGGRLSMSISGSDLSDSSAGGGHGWRCISPFVTWGGCTGLGGLGRRNILESFSNNFQTATKSGAISGTGIGRNSCRKVPVAQFLPFRREETIKISCAGTSIDCSCSRIRTAHSRVLDTRARLPARLANPPRPPHPSRFSKGGDPNRQRTTIT